MLEYARWKYILVAVVLLLSLLFALPNVFGDDPALQYLTHLQEGPDDMPAHIKAALLPVNLSIPVENGRLLLGTWQGIYLFEHRNQPHQRQVAAYFA